MANSLESTFIQTILSKKNQIFFSKHPHVPTKDFNKNLISSLLEKIFKEMLFLIVNFNINLLKTDSEHSVSE